MPRFSTLPTWRNLLDQKSRVANWLSEAPQVGPTPRLLQVLEQPVMLTSVSVLAGVFAIAFSPLIYVCGAGVVLGVHRSRFMNGLSRIRQAVIYACMAIVLGVALHYGIERVQRTFVEQQQSWISQIATKINPAKFAVPAAPTAKVEPQPTTKFETPKQANSLDVGRLPIRAKHPLKANAALSLRQLFVADFNGGENWSFGFAPRNIERQDRNKVQFESKLLIDQAAGVKFVSFYFPRSPYAYDACAFLPDEINEAGGLKLFHIEAQGRANEPINQQELFVQWKSIYLP